MSEPTCHVCKLPYEVGAKRCANCGTALRSGGGAAFTSQELSRLVPKTSSSTPLIFVGALVAAGAVGGVVFARRPAADPPVVEVAQPELAAAEPAERAEPGNAAAQQEPAEPPTPAVPEAPVEPPAPEAHPGSPLEDEPVTLQFLARVVSVKGRGVSKGAKCQVNVHVSGSHIDDLDVSCGDKVLYDSRTPLNGMASMGHDLFERKKGDAWVYRVVYLDTGMRSSRKQIRLDSSARQATVFSESVDAFSVDLRVDEFSLPRKGEPLMGTDAQVAPLEVALYFAAETGTPPKAPRDKCVLKSQFLETSSDGARCKTLLSCGPTILYGKGQTGFGPCDILDGRIVSFEDAQETHVDGDPALEFGSQTVKLSDSPGRVPFGLEFSVPEEE